MCLSRAEIVQVVVRRDFVFWYRRYFDWMQVVEVAASRHVVSQWVSHQTAAAAQIEQDCCLCSFLFQNWISFVIYSMQFPSSSSRIFLLAFTSSLRRHRAAAGLHQCECYAPFIGAVAKMEKKRLWQFATTLKLPIGIVLNACEQKTRKTFALFGTIFQSVKNHFLQIRKIRLFFAVF